MTTCDSCRNVDCLAQPTETCGDHAPITRADLAALEADVVAIRQATLYEIEEQAIANMGSICRDVIEGREGAQESAVNLVAMNERLRGAYCEKYEKVRVLQADLRRLRISQLRRIRDAIASRAGGWANILRDIPEGQRKSWRRRWLDKMERLDAACLAEIERLRGEG